MNSLSTFKDLFENPESTGSALLVGCVDTFGTEFFQWEPETLLTGIQEEFKTEPDPGNLDRIWALVTALTTNHFERDLDAFNHISNALSGRGASFEYWQPADITEICWAVAEIQLVDPPDKAWTFSPDIAGYVGIKMEEEGLYKTPKLLKPYFQVPDRSGEITNTLDADGIDAKAFFDNQQSHLVVIDGFVKKRMIQMLMQVSSLPLKHAKKGALQDLAQRAKKVLGVQEQELQQASESRPQAGL